MNVYIDSKALLKYKNKLNDLFKNDGALHLQILNVKRCQIFRTYRIAKKMFGVKPNYFVKLENIGLFAGNLCKKARIRLSVIVPEGKEIKAQKLIKKYRHNVVLFDKYIDEKMFFDLAYFDHTFYKCNFNSCLGKILYIRANGDIHYCYKHLENSKLINIKDIDDLENIFENGNFEEVLDKTIEKRNNCKSSCKYFEKCGGGCPLEEHDCESFKKNLESAKQERKNIIDNNIDLNTLPEYKKESIIKEISKYSKN